jgi:hypothetical protein
VPDEEPEMTPQEAQAYRDREAARQAVLAKFPDGSAPISDEECKMLTAPEIKSLIVAGRIAGIGVKGRR